jgi:hypothetical protein
MWTNVSLTIRPVWSTAEWTLSATWVDDDGLDPVSAHVSGSMDVVPYEAPERLLEAVTREVSALSGMYDALPPAPGV